MEKETKQETQDKQEKPKRNKKKIAIIAVLVIIAGAFCATSLDRVGQGEVGVVYTMRSGVQEKRCHRAITLLRRGQRSSIIRLHSSSWCCPTIRRITTGTKVQIGMWTRRQMAAW